MRIIIAAVAALAFASGASAFNPAAPVSHHATSVPVERLVRHCTHGVPCGDACIARGHRCVAPHLVPKGCYQWPCSAPNKHQPGR
jgi:hypothetical protein